MDLLLNYSERVNNSIVADMELGGCAARNPKVGGTPFPFVSFHHPLPPHDMSYD